MNKKLIMVVITMAVLISFVIPVEAQDVAPAVQTAVPTATAMPWPSSAINIKMYTFIDGVQTTTNSDFICTARDTNTLETFDVQEISGGEHGYFLYRAIVPTIQWEAFCTSTDEYFTFGRYIVSTGSLIIESRMHLFTYDNSLKLYFPNLLHFN